MFNQARQSLTTLGEASTSRVLNLHRIGLGNKRNPEYFDKPLFVSPLLNSAFVIKRRMQADETYLFDFPRTTTTRLVIPFDSRDLGAGGRSVIAEQRGFKECLKALGNYNEKALDRDIEVLRIMNALPSLDPFLLRQHLENYKIDVAPCYFPISDHDQLDMRTYCTGELTRLTKLLGSDSSIAATGRMVSAMLSSDVAEELAPLRETLGMSGEDFRQGVFSWRGFLYYKWSMDRFWPHVIEVLKSIHATFPAGAISRDQREYIANARRKIVEIVRDDGANINKALLVYDTSFADLVARQAPKAFRDFLLNAPSMFLEVGEKMGAISHIVTFWRGRFPIGAQTMVHADELTAILNDFMSGFGEKIKAAPSIIPQPKLIDMSSRS